MAMVNDGVLSDANMNPDGSEYRFKNVWNIWYHHSLNDWSINGYNKIFTISTIKDFWDFHDNIGYIGGINNVHYFLMKDNILPTWEDPHNKNGGSWSMLIPLEHAYNMWERIAVDMVNSALLGNFNSSVTGMSINQKNNVSIIKIWNNNKNIKDASLLPDYIPKNGNVIYRPHKLAY